MRFWSIAIALAAVVLSTPAQAATIIQTQSVAGDVPFTGFLSSLGTLTSVSLEVSARTYRLGFVDTPAGSPPNAITYSINSYFRLIGTGSAAATSLLGSDPLTVATQGRGTLVQNSGIFDMSAEGAGRFDFGPANFIDAAPFTLSISDPGRSDLSQSGTTFSSSVPATLFQIGGNCRYGSTSSQCSLGTIKLTYGYNPIGAVPEPATWAMMLVGFGGIGFAMRRKSKVTTRVALA